MLHPASAHFAIVLPIIALILGMAYLIKPSELMSKISTRFMLFGAIFITIAFFTGKADGSEVYSLLSGEGKQLLIQHKNFALYLVVGMWIATVVKMFGCLKKIVKVEIFSILLVIIVPSILLGYPYVAALGYPQYANYSVIIASVFHVICLLISIPFFNIYLVPVILILTQLIVVSIRIYGVKKHNLWKAEKCVVFVE